MNKILPKTLFLTYDPRVIEGFKRYALGTDTEVFAYIIGDVWREKGVTNVRVVGLEYPTLRTSTPYEVEPLTSKPRGCVGSIHSHPNCEAVGVSQDDLHSAILDGERVSGVYTYFKGDRTRRVSKLEWFSPGKVVAVCPRKG